MEVHYSNSEEETLRIGQAIGKRLQPPRVVLLYGQLGSGKTVLTRGLTSGLGLDDPTAVRSPSFTLVNEYPTKSGPLYHIDLYRLESQRDLDSIGLEEILSSGSIIIVEWAEKLLPQPEDALTVTISVDLDTGTRRIEIEKRGQSTLSTLPHSPN